MDDSNRSDTDVCECHACGRMHRPLGFGEPPWRKREAELRRFYGVTTTAELIETMTRQVARLQEEVAAHRPHTLDAPRVREG